MPIIKSAKKRVKTTAKASARNSKTKRSLRQALKNFHSSVTGKKDVSTAQSKAHSALDKAVKKNLISKKKAARKKKQMSVKAKASGSKNIAAKKTVAKKAPAKKAPAKKAVAKKAPAKKTTKK